MLCIKLDIPHVFVVAYHRKLNMVGTCNRTLIEIISSYIASHHANRDRFLQHYTYALHTDVHESAGKTPSDLFWGRKTITFFQRLGTVADSGNEFVCHDVDKLMRQAQEKIRKAQKRNVLYYNMRRKELDKKWMILCHQRRTGLVLGGKRE